MAVQTQTGSSAISRPAFKYLSLSLLVFTLFYLVYLTAQPGVQGSVFLGHETVFTFLLLWIQTCHKQVAKPGGWFKTHAIQELDAVLAGFPYHPTYSMHHTKTRVARALENDNPTLGYSQPSFPFNILPGRVETRCQTYSGYALERCKTDVKTRTQLFITLLIILSLVTICVVLITILTCMRRIKARRTAGPASLVRKKKRPARTTFIPTGKNTRGRNPGDRPSRRGIDARQSLDGDEAVEADEQGIDDQDIPVTMDGMTDGWMQWIRQRANMQQLPVSASPGQAHDRSSPPNPPAKAPDAVPGLAPTPRIPSLKLPRPTLSTFRKSRGLEPGPPTLSSQSLKGTGKGKGKERLRVRWDGSV